MDNLKKRDYANFNNSNRGNHRNSPRKDDYRNSPIDREGYGVANQRASNNRPSSRVSYRNNQNIKPVPVQYSKQQKGEKKVNIYDSFSSTIQKKFNSVLYRGSSSNENSKKDKHEKIDINEVNRLDLLKKEEEQQPTIPKSVFIFITVAVIFATGLVFMLAKTDKDKSTKVADNNGFIGRTSKQIDGDDGFETFAEDDESLEEELESLEQGVDNLDVQVVDGRNENDADNKTADSNSDNIITQKNKTATTSKGGSTTSSNTTSIGSDVSQTNVPKATLSPEKADDDNNQELADITEDVGKFTIPTSVSGALYKSPYSYSIIGSDGRFTRYTNYVKESFGTTVPKNELDGIWVFTKNQTLSNTSVSKVYGYRNGISVNVHLIKIQKNGTSIVSYMYALNGAKIDLSDATYKLDGRVIKELEVTGDKTLVKY